MKLTNKALSKFSKDIVIRFGGRYRIESEYYISSRTKYFTTIFEDDLQNLFDSIQFSKAADDQVSFIEDLKEKVLELKKSYCKDDFLVRDQNGDEICSTADGSVCDLANREAQSRNSTKDQFFENLSDRLIKMENSKELDDDDHALLDLLDENTYAFELCYLPKLAALKKAKKEVDEND